MQCQPRVRRQNAKQQMLGLDIFSAQLAGGEASIKNDAPRSLRISFEHANRVMLFSAVFRAAGGHPQA
jgi:hypothetical protein